MPWIEAPQAPTDTSAATARVHLRYEDVSQDGRLLLELMPNALGASVWNAQLSRDSLLRTCMESGVVPILSRFVIEGSPGPFAVIAPLAVTGRFALAEAEDARVVLDMWAELSGPIGRTHPPQPENAGEIAPAGKIFGEHVFTRLFAARGERRVTRADLPESAKSLEMARITRRAFASTLDLPADAKLLGDWAPDDAPTIFGLIHTDSNHHVNSLVYLRLFEEAALRRFAALDLKEPVLARKLEIAYRKPCFAGDRMRIHVRAFEHEGKLCAVTAIAPEGSELASAHACARIMFE